ncbi:SprT-like family-domain-containing protein [Thelephora terrestris]|uniref:SprT-like family-domain-containing protein n=1 Tax=Thelephora terrestris TaxID=56493 RepID=A0A9P6HHT1_9AGAM|nr:SprT-like family-domain-containing protein [Thelephora terrestris]
MREVIEIASDDEDDRKAVAKMPTVIEISSEDDGDQNATVRPSPAKRKPFKHRATRKVLETGSGSENTSARNGPPANVIDLTFEEACQPPFTPAKVHAKAPTRPVAAPRYQSLYSDGESSDGGVFEAALDDSIITYDPPKSAKKPIRIGPPLVKIPSRETVSQKRTAAPKQPTTSDTWPAAPSTPSTSHGSGRILKGAQAAAERKNLEEYTQQFFDSLNNTVFGNGLPPDTQLVWNSRLLTTAGRARWHRNRSGEESTQIELATKILTCKERIRNTLSHEMCHLASWVIDKQVKEAHGQIFKKWGSRVMKAYPDVEVSTRHTYEISYKYEWKCVDCSKIYGRHSKSINPDECLCGSCKTGRLVPLFATRTPKKSKDSTSQKMATTQRRDSPVREPYLCISVPTNDDPPDFLDDLAAAVEGITI